MVRTRAFSGLKAGPGLQARQASEYVLCLYPQKRKNRKVVCRVYGESTKKTPRTQCGKYAFNESQSSVHVNLHGKISNKIRSIETRTIDKNIWPNKERVENKTFYGPIV